MSNGICAGRGVRNHPAALQNGADANGPSLLVGFQPDGDCDDGDDGDDVQIIEPSTATAASAGCGSANASMSALPKATTADGTPVIVFKVTHKAPSGMKRPLAAVDNIRHGDIAVQLYQAFRHRDENLREQIQLQRLINHDVRVMRILGSSQASGVFGLDTMVMQKMLVWDTVGSVPIDSAAVGLQNGDAVNLVEDMVQARAFLGSGRPYEFCGTQKEEDALKSLRDRGLIIKATAGHQKMKKPVVLLEDGDEDSNKWYLTPKAASLLEVGGFALVPTNVFMFFFTDSESESSKSEKVFHSVGLGYTIWLAWQVRPIIGNSKQVFFPRTDLPLEDKTTLELLRDLTFDGFTEITEPMEIMKLKKQPYTGRRGRVPGGFLLFLKVCSGFGFN